MTCDEGRSRVIRGGEPIRRWDLFWEILRCGLSRGQCFVFGALYPSKSELIHKRIVKPIVARFGDEGNTRENNVHKFSFNGPNYGSTECRHINNHLLFPTPPPTNRNPKLDLTTFWCPTPTLLPPPGFSTTDRSLLYSAEACPSPIRRGHAHSSACRGI